MSILLTKNGRNKVKSTKTTKTTKIIKMIKLEKKSLLKKHLKRNSRIMIQDITIL